MGKCAEWRRQVEQLLLSGSTQQEIEGFLLQNSNLPGPRGNLELARAFATTCAAEQLPQGLWELLWSWVGEAMTEMFQPPEREYLPFCALEALGMHYAYATPERQLAIVAALRRCANAPAWRVRESVAIGMQHLAEWNYGQATELLQHWLDGQATLLEARAVAAALAHPPVLTEPDRVAVALSMMQQIMLIMRTSKERKSDQFRVLRQAMEYALSVVVAADPSPGFILLNSLALDDDPDVQRVVRKNLEKKRLLRHGEAVNSVQALLKNR